MAKMAYSTYCTAQLSWTMPIASPIASVMEQGIPAMTLENASSFGLELGDVLRSG